MNNKSIFYIISINTINTIYFPINYIAVQKQKKRY